ncbi:MAG: hypothetical protein R2733_09295 [Acidimicrobiales bacterium]
MIALIGFAGAFIVIAALLVGGVTGRVIDRSRAQAAADAAALAGVAEGRAAAAAMALANDAVLTGFAATDNEVTVEVRSAEGTVAEATAERRLEGFGGG